MKKISLCLAILFSMLVYSESQITVATNNNVGVGTTNPLSKLSINTDGNSSHILSSYASGAQRAGYFELENPSTSLTYNVAMSAYIRNQGVGTKNVVGNFYAYQGTTHSKKMWAIRAVAGNGLSNYNYAVYGQLSGSQNGGAIVGTVGVEPYVPGKFAGYFNGDVEITGDLNVLETFHESDIDLKKEIRLYNESGTSQVSKLKTLSAIQYKYKNPFERGEFPSEVADTMQIALKTSIENAPKYTRDYIGFSAQDVKKVFPELVVEGQDGYLKMNYTGLIPIMVEAIKEQEETILALDAKLEEQAKLIEALAKEIKSLQSSETSK